MKKRTATPTADKAENRDGLVEAVRTLAQELRVLLDVLDDLREEYSWITRNGLSIQPIEHVIVKQMALNPCAKDWGTRLKLVQWSQTPKPAATNDLETLSDFAEHFEAIVHGVAEAELEVLLVALDGVREQVLRAMGKPEGKRQGSSAKPKPIESVPPQTLAEEVSETPPPGRLF